MNFFLTSRDTNRWFYDSNWIHPIDSKSKGKLHMKTVGFCMFFIEKSNGSTFFLDFVNLNHSMTFKACGSLQYMSQVIPEFFLKFGDTNRWFYGGNWVHQILFKSITTSHMQTPRIFCTFFIEKIKCFKFVCGFCKFKSLNDLQRMWIT